MQAAPRLPLGVVTIVLLIAPGLVGLEAYYRYSKKRRKGLSRTRLLIYSTVLSLFSLGLLYVSSPVYFAELMSYVESLVKGSNLVTRDDLSGLQLSKEITLYFAHVLVSVAVGVALGLFSDKILNRGRSQDPRDPWSYGFEERIGNEEEIIVTLRNGRILAGTYLRETWDPEKRELYLDNPKNLPTVAEQNNIDGMSTVDEISDLEWSSGTTDQSSERQRERVQTNMIDGPAKGVVLSSDSISNIYFIEPGLRGGLVDDETEKDDITIRRRMAFYLTTLRVRAVSFIAILLIRANSILRFLFLVSIDSGGTSNEIIVGEIDTEDVEEEVSPKENET